MDVHEVDGLGLKTQREDPCCLIFCKARDASDKREAWRWSAVALPYIERIRKVGGYSVESDPCVASCDGEDRQTMALADEERQRSLLAADVDVDKPSGSTAEASQGCDQESFIAKSDFLKDVSDDDFDANDFRLSSLAKAFADHQTIEASESRSCRGAPSTHVRMGVYGNLKAALAFSKTCALDRAMKSNQKTGQRPLNPDTMMNSLFVHAKPEDRQAFKEALPWGSQIYAANGAVASLEMDDLKVPNNHENVTLI